MYERILVALDGSELAERVLPRVEALARALGSTLILLRATRSPEKLVSEVSVGLEVASPVLLDPTPMVEGEKQTVAAYLETVAARLREAGLTVQTDDPPAPAAEAIVRRAGELGVDLIAMTTHGRTGLPRMIYGSVAEEVLRRAACPILLVRVTEA